MLFMITYDREKTFATIFNQINKGQTILLLEFVKYSYDSID